MANTSVCDSIRLWTIKIYLFDGHHTLGPSVFIPGELTAEAAGCKGHTPSCFTSRNSDKTCTETPQARRSGFNHCLHSCTCIFLPSAALQSASFMKTKITPEHIILYLSLGTMVTCASTLQAMLWGKPHSESKIIQMNPYWEKNPLLGYNKIYLVIHRMYFFGQEVGK